MFSQFYQLIRTRSQILGAFVAQALLLLLIVGQWEVQAQTSFPVNFGDQGAIQFVDPDGLNRIFYTYSSQTSDASINFTLYEISGPQFAQLTGSIGEQFSPETSGLNETASWSDSPTDQDRFATHFTELPDVPSGTYLLVSTVAESGEQNAALITSSRAALVLKADENGRLTAWVSTLRSGEAVADMDVVIYDQEGNMLGTGKTNADGVATIETNSPLDLSTWPFQTFVAVASGANEVTVAGTGQVWRNNSYGGYYGSASSLFTAYLYSERPLYRPGDTIHFKAIVRRAESGSYVVPSGETVEMTLRDSRGDEVDTMELTVDEFGAVHGEFALGEGAPLGSYYLKATLGPEQNAETFQQRLEVEEFRKPEYSVDVRGSTDFGIADQEMEIAVESEYFFGQPVVDANVILRIYESSYRWYTPWWEWGYHDYVPAPSNNLIAEYEGRTDAGGRFLQKFTPRTDAEFTTRYRFVATVTDLQGQPIEGNLTLPVYWNSYEMSLTTGKYGYQSGEAIDIDITLNRHDGTPVADQSVSVAISGEAWDKTSQTVPGVLREVTTDADGKASLTLTSLSQGWYRVRAFTTDDLGRNLERYNYIWIFDPAATHWWYFNSNELTITTDREEYEIGDSAQLLIQSRLTDTVALVTLEREEVLDEFVVKLDGPVTALNVPISEKLAPNAVVQVHLYKPTAVSEATQPGYYYQAPVEAELLTARAELVVPVTHKQLAVRIETDTSEYLPGDQATIQIDVSDHEGLPVRAQVSLALVDEALYALQADLSAGLFETFYSRRQSGIATYQSPIRPYFYRYFDGPVAEDPALEPIGTTTPVTDDSGPPAENESGGGADRADIALREEFLDTAYWKPDILTDEKGRATVTLDLPDNLTTWRIVVKAFTVETQVGEGTNDLLVTQDLITRQDLPPFSVLGDQFRVGAVAQNYTGQDLNGTVDMSCSNLLLLDDGPRNVTLTNNGSDVGYWTAVASHIGSGTVTATLLAGDGGDRVTLPLEVKPFSIPERQAFSAVLPPSQPSNQQVFSVPLNAIHGASVLTIHLSPSLALSLLDDLETLIDYPYGCVEQIMSRLLPSAAASIVYNELGIPNPKQSELPEIMARGVKLLSALQNSSGGWTWYGAGEVNEHISAYVLSGLILVLEAGFDVPQTTMDNGFAYLEGVLTTVQDDDVRAFILYVLSRAGRGDVAATQALVAKSKQLDSFSLSVLIQTLVKEGDSGSADQVLDQLLTRVRETASEAYLPADSALDWYHWKTMASDEKNTAAAISALSLLRPESEVLPKMVRWLLNQRRGSNYYSGAGWKDTHATASAVLGLLDYIQVSRELEANYRYAIHLNGGEVGSGQITPENFTQPIEPLTIPGDQLRFGQNELILSRTEGNGTLYATGALRLQLYYDQFEEATEADLGLKVSRTYYHAGTRQAVNTDQINVGDRIDVEVAVESESETSYVLVTSPIPAGTEVINDGVGTSPFWYDDWYWYDYSYSYKDIRTDKVDFFAPQLSRGTHIFRYVLRATRPGVFSTLPAEAYPMYEDVLWGRSASEQFRIDEELLVERPALNGDFDNDCRVSVFDAQQVAAAWGTSNAAADVSGGDGKIDLRDVAHVAGRIGADCLVDVAAPGTAAGKTVLSMALNESEASVAQSFTADVVLVEGSSVSGLGMTVSYNPAQLRFESVQWHGGFEDSLPLGPHLNPERGEVSFGAFATEMEAVRGAGVGTKIATVVFRGLRSGEANLQLQSVQATNNTAHMVEADFVDSNGQILLDGTTIFMPVIQ